MQPFGQALLSQLYTNKAKYLAEFTRATDKAIASGYLRATDRAAILAEAAKVKV
jgi:hypothetical protein